MNVNERKNKTNSMNNHNVKIPDLIHKYNRGLRQATEIWAEFQDLNYEGLSRDSVKALVHITSPVESLLQLAELVNDSNKVQHRIERYN